MAELTARQLRFCDEYLVDLNATQAAMRAGYSAKTAHVIGPRMLENVRVQARISELQAARSARTEITQDAVLERLAQIAFSKGSRFFKVNKDGDPYVDLRDATEADLDLLREVQVEDFVDGRGEDARMVRKVKIKLADPMPALNLIAQHLGMVVKRLAGADGGPVKVEAVPDLSGLSTDELLAIERMMLKANGDPNSRPN